MKAVASIQKKLNLSDLKVKFIPVTTATRIPLVANGTVDISCDSAVNNAERKKQVAFTTTIFIVENTFLSKKANKYETWADLKGKTVVATSGAITIKLLTTLSKERNLDLKIITVKDHAEGLLMVETGRAAAFVMDDIILASLLANSKQPEDYFISKETMLLGPYGLLLRRNDPEFKKVVDEAIIEVFNSGEINHIYAKWFQSPIPPKGINLYWPVSARLKKIFEDPTDSDKLVDYQ